MHQRAGLNLPSSKPSGGPNRGAVLRVRDCGTGPRSLARSIARRWVLPRLQHDLQCIQTGTQLKNKSFIIELESETIKIWR